MFKITNRNKESFTGRFNGTDYEFPVNKPAMCDDEAAAHIFGIGQTDKTSVLARHGWAGVGKTYADGMLILDQFKFEHIQPQFDAPLAHEIAYGREDHGPAPVVEKPAAKGGADESPKAAGGDEPEWMKDGPVVHRPADQRPGGGRQARA